MKVLEHPRAKRQTGIDTRFPTVSLFSEDDARKGTRRLVALGDEAIRRTMSESSERFLAEHRQEDGE